MTGRILLLFPLRMALEGDLYIPALCAPDRAGQDPEALADIVRVLHLGQGMGLDAFRVFLVETHRNEHWVRRTIPFDGLAPPVDADAVDGPCFAMGHKVHAGELPCPIWAPRGAGK